MNHKLFEKHVFLLFLALLPIGLSVNAEPIEFADDEVKAICVANWDTNGDGELSYEEAAAVTNLGLKFRGNTSITTFDELQYFTGLSKIDNYDFQDCSNLTQITLPNSVISIGYEAFYNCSNLTSFDFNYMSMLSTINQSAFYGCSRLTSFTIPNSVLEIGEKAFYGCGITSITIPNSVLEIGTMAFACTDLISIVVEDNNPAYDSRENCNAIIKTNTNTLVSGCEYTTIPNSVTTIGYGAFAESKLSYITIPESVTTIEGCAFYGCSKLYNVSIPNSVTTIGNEAFRGSYLAYITIPKSVTYIGLYAFTYCSNLCFITVDMENTVYDSRNYCNAIIKTSSNTLEHGCQNTTIPNSVTAIGTGAFGGCNYITSINIPSSVTTIGDWAFAESKLTSIDIPNSVTTISDYAFYKCNKLYSVKIPNSVASIGSNAFGFCSSLTSVVSEITEPYAVYFSSFYYNSNNCVLTVPYGTRDAYIAAGWTEDVFKGGVVEAALEPIKIVMETSSGEARKAMGYSSQYGLDFTDVTDVKAYIASGYTDEGVVLLSRVNIVPPYTGIYLTTEDAGVTVEVPVTYKNTCYANLLYPIVTEQTVEPNVTVGGVDYMTFAVGVLAESDEMGFVKLNASRTMGPNKCILRVPARYYPTEARRMGGFKMMFTDEEATGVDHISTNSRTADDCYDLQGRKVKANEMKQGLYIINGKKVWVK